MARREEAKGVFTNVYILPRSESTTIINGAQITRITARQVEEQWEVTLHLVDGHTEVVQNKWSNDFVARVFGPDPRNP